jgi:hypothetical protein
MFFKQKIEIFRQRKKDLSKKLEYLGFNKEEIEASLKLHYGLIGMVTKNYIKFEKKINKIYEDIKEIYEKLEVQDRKYQENKKEFQKYLKYFN